MKQYISNTCICPMKNVTQQKNVQTQKQKSSKPVKSIQICKKYKDQS